MRIELDVEEIQSCISALESEISEFDTGRGATWVKESEQLIDKLKSLKENHMSVKQFVLFGVTEFYPAGGWDDCQMSFNTFEEAVAHMIADLKYPADPARESDHYHILDLETGAVTNF